MVNFFIHRPIFASSIAIVMVLAGAIALRFLPVAQLPEVTPPQVVVSATYPGASAEVVANTVTTPLEQQINGVPGMIYMSSVSANDGSATITITFKVGYPVDIATVDVQNRVAQAQGQLPAIANQAGITVSKKNPSILLGVSLYSPDGSVDLVDISNYAYLQVVDPLKRLPGVGDVSIFGERRWVRVCRGRIGRTGNGTADDGTRRDAAPTSPVISASVATTADVHVAVDVDVAVVAAVHVGAVHVGAVEVASAGTGPGTAATAATGASTAAASASTAAASASTAATTASAPPLAHEGQRHSYPL
jgi:hypothetical protein